MHVTTEIGVSYEFVLTAAVMIYEDRVHKREQFATIHKIAGEGASGRPSLGAGSLLTTAFLRDLARGLGAVFDSPALAFSARFFLRAF